MGLIPARAGNTDVPAPPFLRARGSSPLARGTLILIPPPYRSVGLIPARAGNTRWRGRFASGCRAHPRSRGEHIAGFDREMVEQGSSPLARGTQDRLTFASFASGLIPARAGNT